MTFCRQNPLEPSDGPERHRTSGDCNYDINETMQTVKAIGWL